MYWVETSRYVTSGVTHMRQEEYNKRGKCGRVSRVGGIKRRLNDGIQWVTKRYSRWYNGG